MDPPMNQHNDDKGDDDETTTMLAMQLASLSVLPMTLKAVVELDVFEIIAKAGPKAYLSPAEIANQLPTENPEAPSMLDRMLRLLASSSIMSCSIAALEDGGVERRYGLAPVCKHLVKNEDGVSAAPLSLMIQDKVFMESWYYLRDAVLDGGVPFIKAYGKTLYEYAGTDPRFNKVMINVGTSDHSILVMKKILNTYTGFEGLGSLVDVGGSIGVTMNLIICKYPHIKGINFDLKHVIDAAPAYPGVKHVVGDMFSSVPRADAIFMKSILHNWNDEQCLILLKNCHKALPAVGKVIIVGMILPEVPEQTVKAKDVFTVDMCMLIQQPRGKERTKREYEKLAMAAGFTTLNAIYCFLNHWIIEMLK